MLLGLNATLTLALSFSLADSLRGAPASAETVTRVWRRALLSATAARLLGEKKGLQSLEELFLAGLLQDIGILALGAALPERYEALMGRPRITTPWWHWSGRPSAAITPRRGPG